MLSSSRKGLRKRQKSEEATPEQCEKIDCVTEDMFIKSEIIEGDQECKLSQTDYEFVSVGHVKTEMPEYEEFPREDVKDLVNDSCSDKLESISSLPGVVKTEMGDDNDDNPSRQSKEIKVVDENIKEEIFRESEGEESNLERNLPKTSGFPCCYCYSIESSLESLSNHIYQDHHVKRVYQCRTCSKVVYSEQSHKSHVSRHRLIQCAHCPYQGTNRTMNTHRKSKHSIQETMGSSFSYKCMDCGMSFRRYYEELEHEKVVHKKVFSLYPYPRKHKKYNAKYKKLS